MDFFVQIQALYFRVNCRHFYFYNTHNSFFVDLYENNQSFDIFSLI